MICANCGHREEFHNCQLNQPLCPFLYKDGECCDSPGSLHQGRKVDLDPVKWDLFWADAKVRETLTPGKQWLRDHINDYGESKIRQRVKDELLVPHVCGCMNFVPLETKMVLEEVP